MKIRLLSSVAIAASVMFGTFCQSQAQQATTGASAAQASLTPLELYEKVYHLVDQKYYDPSFNGQRWSRWEHRYDHQLATLEDARKAIDTMLASLGDRYTRYLNPEAFSGEKQQIEAKLSGIGAQLGTTKEGKIIVVAPLPDTPAEAAGLKSQDEIVKVDDHAVTGMSVEGVSRIIRGPAGTPVKLEILRQGVAHDFTITRGEIELSSVQSVKMLNSDIGYLRLSTFMSERANQDMRAALDRLSPARGIIIDLRNNPGGLLSNALEICNMFLDGGIIVSTVDRQGHVQTVGANGQPISHQPLVLLVNGLSASAAEIASGALHDDKRARLVGQRTFGKGLVQSITRLPDGSGVNITIARYVTPNNTDIHKKGITPDYVVDLTGDPAQGPWFNNLSAGAAAPDLPQLHDIQLLKAVDVLEKEINLAAKPTELRLNPFPNDSPLGSGIGVGVGQ